MNVTMGESDVDTLVRSDAFASAVRAAVARESINQAAVDAQAAYVKNVVEGIFASKRVLEAEIIDKVIERLMAQQQGEMHQRLNKAIQDLCGDPAVRRQIVEKLLEQLFWQADKLRGLLEEDT